MANKRKLCVLQLADRPCVRMRKVVASFRDAGYHVTYLGCRRGRSGASVGDCEVVHIPPRIPAKSLTKAILAPLWAISSAMHIRIRRQGQIIYAADLEAGLAALMSGRPYIYDVLDTYADRYATAGSIRRLLRWVEGLVARRARVLVHVDETRRGTIAGRENALIVQNVPRMSDLRAKRDCIRFDLVASGNLDLNRGVDQLVNAAELLSASVALCGHLDGSLLDAVNRNSRIHYLGYVGSAEALEITRGAKAVFAAYDPSRAINVMACPNKFYDAVVCGVPIVMNKEVALARVIEEEKIGWTFEFGNVEQLVKIVDLISRGDAEYQATRERASRYGERVALWESQFAPVVEAASRVSLK